MGALPGQEHQGAYLRDEQEDAGTAISYPKGGVTRSGGRIPAHPGQNGEEVKRYEGEKKEIKEKAEGIATVKLKSQEMGGNFAYALIFLQIALMLSSIASLTKRHYLWYIALVCNAGWLFFFLDAWLLFY